VIRGNRCEANGNAGIQLAAVRRSIVSENELVANRQGIVVWNDGGGRPFACANLDMTAQNGPYHIAPVCRNIRLPGS
jgi:hypothetical protein